MNSIGKHLNKLNRLKERRKELDKLIIKLRKKIRGVKI